MGLTRNVSLATALRYKGNGPMLTFILHRISGIGMAVFITLHIVAALIGTTGAFINSIYESPAFQLFIFFCVMFHAINGLRITILDLWPALLEHQVQAIWLEWLVFIPLFGVAAFIIITKGLGA